MALFESDIKIEKKLSDFCSDSFMLILQLRSTTEYGDSGLLQKRVLDLLDDFERHSLTSGIEHGKVQSAKFALVAFIDETIIGSEWSSKADWFKEPLQLKLFNCFNAGEEFFTRLEQLRKNQRDNVDVLEVYFLCLSLGYRGKYQMEAPEQVRLIIDDLHQDLNHLIGKTDELLSPHGKPGDEIVNVVKERIPAWVIVVVSFTIGLLFYILMSFLISGKADDVIETLESLLMN